MLLANAVSMDGGTIIVLERFCRLACSAPLFISSVPGDSSTGGAKLAELTRVLRTPERNCPWGRRVAQAFLSALHKVEGISNRDRGDLFVR
jgi:hypothetical protein